MRTLKRSIRIRCSMIQTQLVDDSQQAWNPLLKASIYDIEGQTGIHGVTTGTSPCRGARTP